MTQQLTSTSTNERVVFTCPHCHQEIGQTTKTTLYIGTVLFIERARMKCVKCSHSVRWIPLPLDDVKKTI